MKLTHIVTLSIVVLICSCGEKPPRVTAPEPTKPSRVGPPKRQRPGPVATFGVPKVPEKMRAKLRRYLSSRESRFFGWETRGGGMLVGGHLAGTRQVFRVAQPGGARKQLTFGREQVSLASWIPGSYDSSLILVSQQASDANALHRLDLLEDKRQRLARKGDAYTGQLCWSLAGKLAYNNTARNGRDQDIYIGDASSSQAQKLVYKARGHFEPLDFSPDDKKLLLREVLSRESSLLHILDLGSGSTTPVAERGGKSAIDSEEGDNEVALVAYAAARFAANGKGLYVTSDRSSEFLRLYYYDLGKKTFTPLVDSVSGDIEEIVLSADGRTLAFSTNEEGYSGLYVMAAAKRRRRVRKVDVPKGIVSDLQFSRDRKRPFLLGFTLSQPTSPADSYSYNTRTRKVVRWTTSEVGGLNSDFFVEPRLVQISSLDKDNDQVGTIPAFFYKPPGPGPHPVLVHFHRDATGQFRPGFNPWFQYMLMEQGVAVVAPNLRGSNGLGKTFRRRDDGLRRPDVLEDIGALLDWIQSETRLDAQRVVVQGEFYGALLALNALAAYPTRLKGGIAQSAIFDFLTLIKHLPPHLRSRYQSELGDPEQDKIASMLKKLSPLRQLDKIKAPVLFIHGALNQLSPRKQADGVVKALHEKQREVGYLVAYHEGHWFRVGEGLAAARNQASNFIAIQAAKKSN